MTKEKLTFFVRINNNFNVACRCINSIRRQTVTDYEIKAFVYNNKVRENLISQYEDISFEAVENDKAFLDAFNCALKTSDAKYCMLVDGDSIVSVDAVEEILKHNEDFLVFNISKINIENKFKPFYANNTLNDEAAFIGSTQSVWVFAAKPEFLVRKDISLKGLGSPLQALFMLLCLALSEATCFIKKSLVYKWSINSRAVIDGDFYRRNCADIRRALRAFSKKGNNKARAEAVRVFALAEIEEIYALPLVQRIRRIYALIKTIWF